MLLGWGPMDAPLGAAQLALVLGPGLEDRWPCLGESLRTGLHGFLSAGPSVWVIMAASWRERLRVFLPKAPPELRVAGPEGVLGPLVLVTMAASL